MNAPFFTIVIPVYNRPGEIKRSLDSCVAQTFADLEIIVVDDASQDETPEVVLGYRDPRIKLLRHRLNRGECPSRMTGVAEASAPWVIFLDSDHAFLENGLRLVYEHMARYPGQGRFGFMYEWANGVRSPWPLPDYRILNYTAWLHWLDSCEIGEAIYCTRTNTFAEVRLPDSRAAALGYHLDFARSFETQMTPISVAMQFTDSANRLTNDQAWSSTRLRKARAQDEKESIDRILRDHGGALRDHAPGILERLWRRRIVWQCVLGQRGPAARACRDYLREFPILHLEQLGIALALMHPGLYTHFRNFMRT